ncbi:hypothetical protein CH294_26815 [Rhodococcus sp. 14-2483-1-1]|uniref:hypothetical protein n=1 Tax=unclassified Rhodococcus (in: high G+C Gram-positive bacteria) TaxID=192944 RepID=UPI000B9C087B|nr:MULTISPECIES: hypothetical protein [unclassified Rhodococcus (in: high G+C Gram-positive bacteria)]OZC69776.1 hypothetical protein CH276_02605 [Rhodococcus sp. 06-470-2]OZD01945.1 hypothetical protein CH275_17865 [Rhodococcus sp. 06-235-1A]OZD67417.1 hypothetical protein CH271_14200 [Rhodococcus sp. 05-340-2]OZD71866.1 hypothetical protein CH272_23530 [Rhodococcus sp. 05-340-1]OZE27116.1 hypothetical protein CH262_03435 [Rhodococcus sp. 05-2255-1e]
MALPAYTPGAIDWPYLDKDSAARLWVELGTWVEWLRDRYELGRTIPPCWFKHGPVVEELTAAMFARREAYQQGKNAYHGGPAAWHYQVLWPMVHRMKSITDFEQCTPHSCGFTPPTPAVAGDFAEFIATDIDERDDSPIEPTQHDAAPAEAPSELTMEQVIDMIDTDSAVAEDPADDFTAVIIDDARWEYDEATETYKPAP